MTRKASRSSLWLAALAVLLIAGAAALGWRLAEVAPSEAQGEAAQRPPDVQLAALGGGTMGLGDFEGEVVVVDFWASWCAPCRLQAKILAPLHEELGERVQFLAVNLGEDLATVERYVAKNAFPYPVLMDPEERLGVDLAIYALPTVMVLDRAGRIAYLRAGISDRPTLTDALSAAGAIGPEARAAG
jgi:thiol-disulfide isomerase/thioredoxin